MQNEEKDGEKSKEGEQSVNGNERSGIDNANVGGEANDKEAILYQLKRKSCWQDYVKQV